MPDDLLLHRFRDETKVNESIARRDEGLIASANEDQFCVSPGFLGVALEPFAKKRNVFPDFLAAGVNKLIIG